jgi:hypothetical protein
VAVVIEEGKATLAQGVLTLFKFEPQRFHGGQVPRAGDRVSDTGI